MAEQKTYSIKIDGIEQSVKGVESLGSAVGSNASSMKELRKALKAVQDEMAGLDKNSEQWKKLAKVAGEYQDKMDDIRQATRRFASDTKALDDVINIGQSMTSVFTLAQGAMSAFGLETEGAVESIQKLQGAMAIIQSLQSLQNTLKGSSATATLYTKAMNLLTMAMGKGSTASKALRGAMLAIPLMLVITAVTELVMHWDELVGWFTKTFPALKNLSTWFDKVKGAIAGVGNAVWEAIKTFGSLGDILSAIFSGNFDKAAEIAKNSLNKITQAFKTGYADKMAEIQEEVTIKETEENNKRTKHQLEMLKAQKGNAAKYSKEGIELQKKDFEERKKLAKGNKDELNKIAVEEASFYRECQEQKSAAANKAAANAKKAAKERAEAEKKAEKERAEAEKKAAEEAKKAAEYRAKADEALYRSELEYLIKQQEQLVENYNDEVKLYSTGNVEKYQEAVAKVNEETKKLDELQKQLHLYDFFNDYKQNIDESATSLNNFIANMNVLVEQFKVFGDKVSVEEFGIVTKQLSMFSNLTEDQLKYLYHIYIDYLKDGLTKTKETDADILAVQEEQLKKEQEGIEKTTLKFELENDKKSENAINLVNTLNEQWDNYLEHVKNVYGEDSKEYLEALKKKKEAIGKKKRDDDNPFMDLFGEDENGAGVDWDKVGKRIEQAYDAYAAPIVEGLGDSIHMMLEFAIEEAENALAEAEALHDEAVDKVEESKDRISEINDKMKESSGAQLEQYKQQMADEVLLLQQREQEEKRLQKEKEKREKELEKQKKKQRKLELQQQLIQAIVSGALAVVNGLATQPFVPVGIAMGALAGVATAIQIATITKQISKLADGGLLQGRSHAQGGIAVGNTGIEVEGGEYVVNKRSTAKYLPLLQQINEEGARKKTVANQLGKMADGGQLNYERINSNMDALNTAKIVSAAIEGIEMHPVVSVIDINRGQKNLTEVRQLAGAKS